MTVKELIEDLSQYPENTEVVSFYDYTMINSDDIVYDKKNNQVIIYF